MSYPMMSHEKFGQGSKKKGVVRFISFGGRFTSSLSFSMSAPPNAIEPMSVTEPILTDEEVVNVAALAWQLKDAKMRNARIEKKQDWVAAKKRKEEQDEADRLVQEAEQKAKKANKKKQVSSVLTFRWSRLMEFWTWPRNCPRYHWYRKH